MQNAAAQAAVHQIYAGNCEASATTAADLVMQRYGYTASNLTRVSYLDSTGAATASASNVTYVQASAPEPFPCPRR